MGSRWPGGRVQVCATCSGQVSLYLKLIKSWKSGCRGQLRL